MINSRLHFRARIDGLIRCVSICILGDYLGSIYHKSFTTVIQCYLVAALFACVIFGVHVIFAVKEKELKRVIHFSLFSFLWCHICKAIVFVVSLSGNFHFFSQKETFYGEAFEMVIVYAISHALFVVLVFMMWLIMLINNRIKKKRNQSEN